MLAFLVPLIMLDSVLHKLPRAPYVISPVLEMTAEDAGALFKRLSSEDVESVRSWFDAVSKIYDDSRNLLACAPIDTKPRIIEHQTKSVYTPYKKAADLTSIILHELQHFVDLHDKYTTPNEAKNHIEYVENSQSPYYTSAAEVRAYTEMVVRTLIKFAATLADVAVHGDLIKRKPARQDLHQLLNLDQRPDFIKICANLKQSDAVVWSAREAIPFTGMGVFNTFNQAYDGTGGNRKYIESRLKNTIHQLRAKYSNILPHIAVATTESEHNYMLEYVARRINSIIHKWIDENRYPPFVKVSDFGFAEFKLQEIFSPNDRTYAAFLRANRDPSHPLSVWLVTGELSDDTDGDDPNVGGFLRLPDGGNAAYGDRTAADRMIKVPFFIRTEEDVSVRTYGPILRERTSRMRSDVIVEVPRFNSVDNSVAAIKDKSIVRYAKEKGQSCAKNKVVTWARTDAGFGEVLHSAGYTAVTFSPSKGTIAYYVPGFDMISTDGAKPLKFTYEELSKILAYQSQHGLI